MNNKLASFFCDPKTAIKNVAMLALMIFIVVYAGFQILPSFSEKLKTETALEVTVFDANVTTGYIFRNEEPIMNGAGNDRVVVTLVKDGEKISNGQHFANAYVASDYAEIQEQIDVIEDKINVLEKSAVETDAYITDLSKTDDAINASFDKIYSSVSDGILENVNSVENELLINMNKRNLITRDNDGYTSEVLSLKQQKKTLEGRISAYSDRVTAQNSGYYYGDTDGFERIFDVDLLDELSHESFREIVNMSPENDVLNSNYGKIVKDFVWYLVCESDKNSAAGYKENKDYSLVFPSFSDEEMTLTLKKIIKNTGEKTVLLVFRGNTAPEGFPYSRSQQVNIISGEQTGFAVPKDAVRIKNGMKGVYILNGDIVRFRRIETIAEDGDYYIVKKPKAVSFSESDENKSKEEKDNEEITYRYLSLYDNVIVGGKNLFDGKIVG